MGSHISPKAIIAAMNVIEGMGHQSMESFIVHMLETRTAQTIAALREVGLLIEPPQPKESAPPKADLYKLVVTRYNGPISLIKLVRNLTGLGLKESKDVIDQGIPSGRPLYHCDAAGDIDEGRTLADHCWPLPGVIAEALTYDTIMPIAANVRSRLMRVAPDVEVTALESGESYELPLGEHQKRLKGKL